MNAVTPILSIVVPVFNERANLAPLLEEIETVFSELAHEVLAVDDGSTDGSLEELDRLSNDYDELRVVSLEAHAGQSAALAAGFDAARGQFVLTMDADGQNDPADGLRLWEVVCGPGSATAAVGYRVQRADSRWKRLQSRVANLGRDLITGDAVKDTGCSLKVMPRSALARIPRFRGMHRFLPTLLRWDGQEVLEIGVSHRRRWSGRSKYGAWSRLWVGIRDAFGVRWLLRRRLVYRTRENRRGEKG
ncbi:MAG: glycosyltransferase [Gemmatimonadetes bacterium]|nr:glycosyltransferase [Gemmatimonadota bacterium]